MRSESRQELDRLGPMIAVGSAIGSLPPAAASARNGGKWPHLIHAHHYAIFRRDRDKGSRFYFFLTQTLHRGFRTKFGLRKSEILPDGVDGESLIV